jgi:hypothetical protein
MASKWENFLRNMGRWQGSFTNVDARGVLLGSTASILDLEADEDGRLVHFRLRRFADDARRTPPIHDVRQDYRSLGRQVVFFDSGAFSKGAEQVAPFTAYGAEYGFVAPDRRLRLVQLYSEAGSFDRLVLIREFRSGSDATENPPLTPDQLEGDWQGSAQTIAADWPEPTGQSSASRFRRQGDVLQVLHRVGDTVQEFSGRLEGRLLRCEGARPRQWTLLPDGGWSDVPPTVSHRQAFQVAAGWLVAPHRLERLIRSYDDRGAWVASTHVVETRVA